MTRTHMTIIATVSVLQDEPAMIAYVRERLFAAAQFPGLPLERVRLDAEADRIEFSVQHYDDPQAWLAEMLRRERIIAHHDRMQDPIMVEDSEPLFATPAPSGEGVTLLPTGRLAVEVESLEGPPVTATLSPRGYIHLSAASGPGETMLRARIRVVAKGANEQ